MKKRPKISPRIFWLASILFFISGGTGLAYQLIWFKRFSHVWGSSSLAFAAVGGSFLFGLGLGAYLLGRFADRLAVPLRWYGLCEFLIGTLALVIPFEISTLVDASVGLYAGIPEQPFLRYLVQFGITLLVIGPPCVLMGGTLPLLIRQLTAREGALDQAMSWLYAINTFGAAAGCYLTGFHFLPSFGLLWTNNGAAFVNITIGVVSILVSRSAQRRAWIPKAPALAPDSVSDGLAILPLASLYLATTLSGCAALMLEMTWSRQLAVVLGGSTYAFTATLFVVLIGIALGSLIFHWRLRTVVSLSRVALVIVGVLAVTALVGKWLLPTLSVFAGLDSVRATRGDQFFNGAICVATSVVLEFLPAVAMGLLFPLFVRMTEASAARVGAAVGNIYAWNTLGSIAGASMTAVLLFPRIGTAGSMAVAVGLYVVVLLAVMPWRRSVDFAWGGGVLLVGMSVTILLAQPIDPRLTNLGLYMYGQSPRTEVGSDWMSKIDPLFFREGASTNVLVTRTTVGDLALRVNGKIDASNSSDMIMQLGLAYMARIFKPDAKEVLVIGLGSGSTSGASLLFPETRVTTCEIEPAIYEAAKYFAEYNHRPSQKSRFWLEARNAELPPEQRLSPEEIDEQARFSIVYGDGRTAIQGSKKKYDLILSEPSNPWLAGVSNLFTKEFFHAVREHLTEGGVLVQWIQTYNFTLSDYTMIVRTLRTEFPHFGVILFGDGYDTLLMASSQPLMPEVEELMAWQKIVDKEPSIQADLDQWFGTTDVRHVLVENYQLGENQLNRLVDHDRSDALNTDLNMNLEFDAPLHLFRDLPRYENATFALLSAADLDWFKQLVAQVGVREGSGEFHLMLGTRYHRRGANAVLKHLGEKEAQDKDLEKAAAEFKMALAAQPDLVAAYRGLARVRVLQERYAEAAKPLEEWVRLDPDNAIAHAELAQQLLRLGDTEKAASHFREALRLQPEVSVHSGSIIWANNLAWILATNPDPKIRNGREAVDWARKACEASGYQVPSTLDTLAAALAEAGDFDEAIKISEQLIDLSANEPTKIATAKVRIALYRSSQPFHEQ